ncbi:hypothetical protein VTL71DRAFT_9544 [Oculimacula yallundae]|uniref:Uncharacterized protein n=1 Tax=Oculimacula yallundae TaxID=86028 RepID=A0ABR4BSB4_9HELO
MPILLLSHVPFGHRAEELEVISRISDSEHGLAHIASEQYWYYAWTYGPTAILTLFLALWNRVDFRIRQMAPWKDLNPQQLSSRDKALFLDYISPTVPEILWHSARRRNFTVLASNLVSVLTTILIVVSTSLLTPAGKSIRIQGTQYRAMTGFLDTHYSILPKDSTLPLDTVDAVEVAGLAYPTGTTSSTNYQAYEVAGTELDGIHEVELNVTSIDMKCEPATITVNSWTNEWTCPGSDRYTNGFQKSDVVVQSGNCSMPIKIITSSVAGNDGNTGNFAFVNGGKCSNKGAKGIYDARLAFGLGRAVQHGSMGSKPTVTDYYSSSECDDNYPTVDIELLESYQWICTTQIALTKAQLRANASEMASGKSPEINILPDAPKHHFTATENGVLLDGASQLLYCTTYNDEHTSELFQSLNLTRGIPDTTTGGRTPDNQYASFVRMLRRAPLNTTFEDLMDTDLLVRLTETWWKQVYVQLLNKYYTKPLNDSIVEGTTLVLGEFLTVRDVPLRLMQALLCASIILIVYILTTHRHATSYDPARLVGIFLLLRSQTQIRKSFHDTGPLAMEDLEKRIEARSKGIARKPLVADVKDLETLQKWWHPLVLRIPARACVAVLVLAVIIVLQVLLMLPDKGEGLADISATGNMHLAWSIIPALAMVGIAMYIRALGSCYKAFAPYFRLRRGTSSQALFSNYMAATEVEVFIGALRNRDWAIACVATSIIFSPFLTIIVSGVWTSAPVALTREQDMVSQSFFTKNYSANDAGNSGGNAFLSGLIVGMNLSSPKWTHEDLAFASYTTNKYGWDRQSTMQVELPAIRVSLNCTFYPQEEIPDLVWDTHTQNAYGGLTPAIAIIKMPGPAHCRWKNVTWVGTGGTAESGVVTVTKVRVDTTLTSDLNISSSHAPQVVPGSASFFSDTTVSIPYDRLPLLVTEGTNNRGFWGVVQYKYGGDFISNFGSVKHRNKIIVAIKRTHGIIRAQQYHAEMRLTEAAVLADVPKSLTATVRNPQQQRLLQNAISTHVLCALLAVILIFALLASCLLADSTLFADKDMLNGGAQRKQCLQGRIFRMGWFEGDTGQHRLFTINAIDTNGVDLNNGTELVEHDERNKQRVYPDNR